MALSTPLDFAFLTDTCNKNNRTKPKGKKKYPELPLLRDTETNTVRPTDFDLNEKRLEAPREPNKKLFVQCRRLFGEAHGYLQYYDVEGTAEPFWLFVPPACVVERSRIRGGQGLYFPGIIYDDAGNFVDHCVINVTTYGSGVIASDVKYDPEAPKAVTSAMKQADELLESTGCRTVAVYFL